MKHRFSLYRTLEPVVVAPAPASSVEGARVLSRLRFTTVGPRWTKKPGWVAPEFNRFVAMRRFGALDGLRALSVIAVVWQHASGMPGPVFLKPGDLGVDFFFAISGFLITSLLVREGRTAGRISLRKFYARRALRIFPLYYATLLAYIVLMAATCRHKPEGTVFFRRLPTFATYTYNWWRNVPDHNDTWIFVHSWSLATEEQFYLLWPPLLVATLAIVARRRIWPPLAVLAVLIAISQGAELIGDDSMLAWRIPASLSLPILLGAAAALVLNTRRGFDAVCAVLGRVWSAPLAAVLLVAAIAADSPRQITQILMVAVVVGCCVTEWTLLHPTLQWRPLAFVGVISYGVYLLHMLCYYVIAHTAFHEESGLLVFAATLVLVIVVAYLSFRFFETPVLKLKRRYESSSERDGDELSRIRPAAHQSTRVIGAVP